MLSTEYGKKNCGDGTSTLRCREYKRECTASGTLATTTMGFVLQSPHSCTNNGKHERDKLSMTCRLKDLINMGTPVKQAHAQCKYRRSLMQKSSQLCRFHQIYIASREKFHRSTRDAPYASATKSQLLQ